MFGAAQHAAKCVLAACPQADPELACLRGSKFFAEVWFMTASALPSSDIRPVVDTMIARGLESRASDIHVEPLVNSYEVRFRIDGLLQAIDSLSADAGIAMVNRLMVMARLLTYRRDIPQEGRIALPRPKSIDLRLSVMPTLHGLRAVIRMPAELQGPHRLLDLNLSAESHQFLMQFCAADSGMLVIIGPAGSGKTTTIYALLGHLAASRHGESIISLEDPIERCIGGVTQIEVNPFGELNYATAMKSILRQDPQILAVGEIRDGATASLAVQAALTGHRLLCTMHAGSPMGAVRRLLEMGIQRYQLTNSIFGFFNQRLVRRKSSDGYRGRIPVSNFLRMDAKVSCAILAGTATDAETEAIAPQTSEGTLWQAGVELVRKGITDKAELERVLGRPE